MSEYLRKGIDIIMRKRFLCGSILLILCVCLLSLGVCADESGSVTAVSSGSDAIIETVRDADCLSSAAAEIPLTVSENSEMEQPSVSPSNVCGDNLTWTLDEYGNFVVSGEGEMWDFEENCVPWSSYLNEIECIIINEGVTHIGSYAFQDCYNL
jgi:hypothetical protein